MATSAVVVHWGTPIPTRERMALEEFSSYMSWANKLKKDGKIERFEVYQLTAGTFQKRSGFTIMEGNEQQIRTLTESDEFRARIDRVMNVTQNAQLERCDVGANVGQRMQLYGSVLQQLGL